MVWILLLLFSYCPGALSQFTLTQPTSASASLAGRVQLSCTITGPTFGVLDWYQQKEGKSPAFLLKYTVVSDKTDFGSDFESSSGRFSASVDSSKRNAYLTISNVEGNDEAAYYCFTSYQGEYIFGSGTHLEVTTAGQPAVPPKVHLFPPSSEELTSKRKGTLVCLIDDFTPGAIDVTWLADGSPITSNVETTRPTKRNDKYVASSYLSLTAAEYEEKDTFTCKVTHDSKDYQKSVQRAACSA